MRQIGIVWIIHDPACSRDPCYNEEEVYNWSVNEEALRTDADAHAIWVLEQQINFGLNGTKINERQLRAYWPRLSIDPARRRFLHFLLSGTLDPESAADQTA